jgi:AraC family transcriptional regulator of adaptative response/methylated-DNA-[protein]-cysteine methyltransferase
VSSINIPARRDLSADDSLSLDYFRVERAIQFLDARAGQQPSLAEVAASAGLSEFHFQRLFSRWAGISPKRFLQFQTATHARQLLRESRSVLDATYEAGLSSPSRLHDLLVSIDAVTPGEFKTAGAGLTIEYGVHPSPFGDMFIAVTSRGVCSLAFVQPGEEAAAVAELREQWGGAELRESVAGTRALAERVFAPREPGAAPLNLYVRGTNFQLKVWDALLRIPPGAVASYEHLAVSIGAPHATRAVASAVARNPVAYLIPCHRVIRKTGAFGQYRWGPERKRAMLGWEAARAAPTELAAD